MELLRSLALKVPGLRRFVPWRISGPDFREPLVKELWIDGMLVRREWPDGTVEHALPTDDEHPDFTFDTDSPIEQLDGWGIRVDGVAVCTRPLKPV